MKVEEEVHICAPHPCPAEKMDWLCSTSAESAVSLSECLTTQGGGWLCACALHPYACLPAVLPSGTVDDYTTMKQHVIAKVSGQL